MEYWIGEPYWEGVKATDAVSKLMTYGFDELK